MFHGYRTLSSLLLIGALAVPIGVSVTADAQEQERHDQNDNRDQDRDNHHDHDANSDHDKKLYDKEHREYHEWNVGEDTTYRHWLSENHREYKDFNSISAEQQQAYWNWRREHPDAK